MPLRNIGPGIAVIDRDNSWLLGHPREGGELTRYVKVSTATPAVPTDEEFELTFMLNPSLWGGINEEKLTGRPNINGEFGLDVRYTDWAGQQPTTVRVLIAGHEEMGRHLWDVYRIEYRVGDAKDSTLAVDFSP